MIIGRKYRTAHSPAKRGAGARIGIEGEQRLLEFFGKPAVESIHPLRTVEGDEACFAARFNNDGLVVAMVTPWRIQQCDGSAFRVAAVAKNR
jgi:hypothetical protein